jgi:hypothetical protein
VLIITTNYQTVCSQNNTHGSRYILSAVTAFGLMLQQSDAAFDQSGELQEEIDRSEVDVSKTTKLQHEKGEEVRNCV